MNKYIFTVIFLFLMTFNVFAKEIAITFDDTPRSGSSFMSAIEKTEKIIKELKDRKVNDALFFVTTNNIVDESSSRRLQRYVDEGFHLANHSHSHQSSRELKPDEYLSDFYTSHLISKDFKGLIKLHRFPFLHQPSEAKDRKKIYQGLTNFGYELGYVTVDNYDWYINSEMVNAHKKGLKINIENMKKLYLDSIWDAIRFYDEVAKKALGRSPKHILLLHENEIAALFIGDLVDHIQSKGWKIISPQEAYKDPISKMYTPELEFTNQGLVAAIAHSQGVKKEDLRHPSENTDYLDRKFEEYRTFEDNE